MSSGRYYVYGFAAAGAGPAVLCVPWTGPDPVVSRELALAHARAVAEAAAVTTVLPCAAGCVVTEAELSAWLDERRDALLAALHRLDGRVEFVLKLSRAEAGAPPAGGREYLSRLLGERRLRTEVRAVVERLPAEVISWSEPRDLLLQAELLVARDGARRLQAAWAQVAAELPPGCGGARLSGPWPPYYFAGVILNGEAGVGRQSGRCGAGAGPAGAGAGGAAAAADGAGGGPAG